MHADMIVSLLTLTLMEIVLGIDNIIFIAILCGKLPESQRDKGRKVGLALALITRLLLLSAINWVKNLTTPLFNVGSHHFTGQTLILLIGGLFLVAKATHEIHDKLEVKDENGKIGPKVASFGSVVVQIMLLDIVFSLDSVITAIGMADHLIVMMAAVILAVGVMLLFSGAIARFVERHPTIKILALSFLILIGVTLIAEGWGQHVSKGYIYFAMAFSLGVEFLNMRYHKVHAKPVQLNGPKADLKD